MALDRYRPTPNAFLLIRVCCVPALKVIGLVAFATTLGERVEEARQLIPEDCDAAGHEALEDRHLLYSGVVNQKSAFARFQLATISEDARQSHLVGRDILVAALRRPEDFILKSLLALL